MNVNRDLEIDGPAIKHLRTVFEDKTTHEKFINALDEKLPRYTQIWFIEEFLRVTKKTHLPFKKVRSHEIALMMLYHLLENPTARTWEKDFNLSKSTLCP